jgi:heme oxygenase (biliverdin-producing, ferredoxin)
MAKSLAAKLRSGTAELHALAERSGIMSELIKGQVDATSYTALLRNYYEIYDALETALHAHSDHSYIAPFLKPQWLRAHRLSADLDRLHAGQWQVDLPVMPAAASYRNRLESLRDREPELLVAHTYVRYLGDLHGGQRLRSIIARGLQLTAPHGTSFYDFDGPATVAEHIKNFRSALDSLQGSNLQHDRIVAEAQDAFARHTALFEELRQWRATIAPV